MRIYQYAPILQTLDIDLQISPLLRDGYLKRLYAGQATNWPEVFGDYLMRTVGLLRARKYDLLWIEKELFPNLPAWFEQALSALGVRYVIDIDDAIFDNYSRSSGRYQKLLTRKINKVMTGSALVLWGNDYLAEQEAQSTSYRCGYVGLSRC